MRAPNANHVEINRLKELGHIRYLITQNVDGLHIKAGSTDLVELHGNSHRVHCLDCRRMLSRHKLQDMMRSYNKHWHKPEDLVKSHDMAPDADAVLTNEEIDGFKMFPCPHCGGRLKPDVVFFGDNVNYQLVQLCYSQGSFT